MPGHAAQNTVGAVQTQCLRKEELSSGCKTDCEDALLILPGRKRISLRTRGAPLSPCRPVREKPPSIPTRREVYLALS